MWAGLNVKHPLFLSDFLDRSFKNTQKSVFMKICPVRAEVFHADSRTEGRTDRRTDMKKLIVVFRNCSNSEKKNRGDVTKSST